MNLRFLIPVLDIEVFRIELDLGQDDAPKADTAAKVVEKGVGIVSDWWLKRLFKR